MTGAACCFFFPAIILFPSSCSRDTKAGALQSPLESVRHRVSQASTLPLCHGRGLASAAKWTFHLGSCRGCCSLPLTTASTPGPRLVSWPARVPMDSVPVVPCLLGTGDLAHSSGRQTKSKKGGKQNSEKKPIHRLDQRQIRSPVDRAAHQSPQRTASHLHLSC